MLIYIYIYLIETSKKMVKFNFLLIAVVKQTFLDSANLTFFFGKTCLNLYAMYSFLS